MTLRTAAAPAALMTIAVASASAAPQRDMLLRPGVGAGKLRLGMTFEQAKAALGRPDRSRRVRPFGSRVPGPYAEHEWGLEPAWKVGVYGRGESARVVVIETTRPERTRSGVGVGSTRLALQRKLRTRCHPPAPSPLPGPDEWPGYPLTMACWHGGSGPGRQVTSTARPVTIFQMFAKCSIPTGRYILCPKSKRTYIADSVWIADATGQRIWGSVERR